MMDSASQNAHEDGGELEQQQQADVSHSTSVHGSEALAGFDVGGGFAMLEPTTNSNNNEEYHSEQEQEQEKEEKEEEEVEAKTLSDDAQSIIIASPSEATPSEAGLHFQYAVEDGRHSVADSVSSSVPNTSGVTLNVIRPSATVSAISSQVVTPTTPTTTMWMEHDVSVSADNEMAAEAAEAAEAAPTGVKRERLTGNTVPGEITEADVRAVYDDPTFDFMAANAYVSLDQELGVPAMTAPAAEGVSLPERLRTCEQRLRRQLSEEQTMTRRLEEVVERQLLEGFEENTTTTTTTTPKTIDPLQDAAAKNTLPAPHKRRGRLSFSISLAFIVTKYLPTKTAPQRWSPVSAVVKALHNAGFTQVANIDEYGPFDDTHELNDPEKRRNWWTVGSGDVETEGERTGGNCGQRVAKSQHTTQRAWEEKKKRRGGVQENTQNIVLKRFGMTSRSEQSSKSATLVHDWVELTSPWMWAGEEAFALVDGVVRLINSWHKTNEEEDNFKRDWTVVTDDGCDMDVAVGYDGGRERVSLGLLRRLGMMSWAAADVLSGIASEKSRFDGSRPRKHKLEDWMDKQVLGERNYEEEEAGVVAMMELRRGSKLARKGEEALYEALVAAAKRGQTTEEEQIAKIGKEEVAKIAKSTKCQAGDDTITESGTARDLSLNAGDARPPSRPYPLSSLLKSELNSPGPRLRTAERIVPGRTYKDLEDNQVTTCMPWALRSGDGLEKRRPLGLPEEDISPRSDSGSAYGPLIGWWLPPWLSTWRGIHVLCSRKITSREVLAELLCADESWRQQGGPGLDIDFRAFLCRPPRQLNDALPNMETPDGVFPIYDQWDQVVATSNFPGERLVFRHAPSDMHSALVGGWMRLVTALVDFCRDATEVAFFSVLARLARFETAHTWRKPLAPSAVIATEDKLEHAYDFVDLADDIGAYDAAELLEKWARIAFMACPAATRLSEYGARVYHDTSDPNTALAAYNNIKEDMEELLRVQSPESDLANLDDKAKARLTEAARRVMEVGVVGIGDGIDQPRMLDWWKLEQLGLGDGWDEWLPVAHKPRGEQEETKASDSGGESKEGKEDKQDMPSVSDLWDQFEAEALIANSEASTGERPANSSNASNWEGFII